MVEGVDMSAHVGQFRLHARVEGMHVRLVVEAMGDAGLIGDHEHKIARLVEGEHGFARAFHPPQLLGPVGVAVVDVEHAVAVEEGGGARQPHGQLAPRLRQSFRQADVEEIAVEHPALDGALSHKGRKHVLLDGAGAGDTVENRAPEQIEPAIDEPRNGPRSGGGLLFGEGGDTPAVQLDRAVARRVRHRAQGDARKAGSRRRERQGAQVDVEPGIAVRQQEPWVEDACGVAQRAAGARRLRLADHADGRLPDPASVIEALDAVAQMAGQKHDVGEAVAHRLLDQQIDEQHVRRDRKQRLRRGGRHRTETRSLAPDEEDCLPDSHATYPPWFAGSGLRGRRMLVCTISFRASPRSINATIRGSPLAKLLTCYLG
ncbi:hypothetical protein CF98_11075 [Halopseudomonas bauzanensis]|nr:hypothetical protein CF98_11075 [Halopseudomonas bauzanensis]